MDQPEAWVGVTAGRLANITGKVNVGSVAGDMVEDKDTNEYLYDFHCFKLSLLVSGIIYDLML